MATSVLHPEDLERLGAELAAAGFDQHRDALLASLRPGTRAKFRVVPEAESPVAHDLAYLDRHPTMRDHEPTLGTWLEGAIQHAEAVDLIQRLEAALLLVRQLRADPPPSGVPELTQAPRPPDELFSQLEAELHDPMFRPRLDAIHQGLDRADAVVRIRAGTARGTGFLVEGSRVIFGAHLATQAASREEAVAEFFYEDDLFGVATAPVALRLDANGVAAASVEGLVSVRLALGPPEGVQALELQPPPELGASVHLVGHPSGGARRITLGRYRLYSATANALHLVGDDDRVAAGGPVFDQDWRVIGVQRSVRTETVGGRRWQLIEATPAGRLGPLLR